MEVWEGIFGKKYTDRNFQSFQQMENLHRKSFGISRTEMNLQFLSSLNRSLKILEVGCNIGNQLLCLQKIDFNNLFGIELQSYAVKIAKTQLQNIKIFQGSIFNLPFKTESFDFIFTSNVLIHISPTDIKKALAEIYRCSRRYIWGFEYYSDKYEKINYRGQADLLWKTNFAQLYLDQFRDLKLIKEKKYKHLNDENLDSIFLLRKD